MKSERLVSLLTILKAIALCLVAAMALASLYEQVSRGLGLTPWLGAALTNSVLATLALGKLRSSHRTDFPSWLAYTPALLVLAAALTAVAVSRLCGGAQTGSLMWPQIAWVLWVPLVEELVFRIGLGGVFRRLSGVVWGAYFSAVTFALVHAAPTPANVAAGHLGLPLGPLLLGLAAEGLYIKSRRLGPIVALHAACNATALIFTLGDTRWLSWLELLYS